jgi:hypothetical protein
MAADHEEGEEPPPISWMPPPPPIDEDIVDTPAEVAAEGGRLLLLLFTFKLLWPGGDWTTNGVEGKVSLARICGCCCVAPLGKWATDRRLPHHQATKAGVGVAGESQ